MNSKLVSAICFRLLAIYVMVRAVIALPELWMQYIGFMRFAEAEPSRVHIWYLGGGSLLLLIGLLMSWLLWKASQAVLRDLPAESNPHDHPQQIGYRLLGFFFLISGLSLLPSQGLLVWELADQHAAYTYRVIRNLSEPCVLIVSGLFLVIGKGALVDFLRHRFQGLK